MNLVCRLLLEKNFFNDTATTEIYTLSLHDALPICYFFESFSSREFEEKVCKTTFVQDNESFSGYGVVRGLHFQKPPFTQSKIVRVIKGSVLDVAVDIRKGSPTFGQHVAVELTGENHRQLFIPRGFAHGFAVLSDEVLFRSEEHTFELQSPR